MQELECSFALLQADAEMHNMPNGRPLQPKLVAQLCFFDMLMEGVQYKSSWLGLCNAT